MLGCVCFSCVVLGFVWVVLCVLGWCVIVFGCFALFDLVFLRLICNCLSCFRVFRCLNCFVFSNFLSSFWLCQVVLSCVVLFLRLCQFVLRLFKVVSRLFCKTHS